MNTLRTKLKIEWKNILSVAISCILLSFFLFPKSTHAAIPTPIFQESFESFSQIQADGGTARGVTIEPGKSGNGVRVHSSGSLLSFPVAGHLNMQKGTIEFWVKPNWDGNTGGYKSFFSLVRDPVNPKVDSLQIFKQSADYNYFSVKFHDQAGAVAKSDDMGNSVAWKAGEWHRVRLFWDFTLPTPQKYLMIQLDDKYGNYTTTGSAANWNISSRFDGFRDMANARFFLGSQYNGVWQLNAVIDELKIWDQAILPVTPFPVFNPKSSLNFNPDKQSTVDTFRQLYANDGFCSATAGETYNNQPNDCPKLADNIAIGKNVVFFQKPAFERVYENYVPKDSEISNQFSGQATPGEYETIFFGAYARADLATVRVDYTDLQGASGTIPRENIDLRVVKNWFQGAALQLPYYTPELMLHNDQITLSAKQFSGGPYDIPSIPKLNHVKTKINRFTSRQFAMIIKVPEGVPAGDYTSTISFSADGLPDQNLQMNFTVLPFKLQDNGRMYTLWYAFQESFYRGFTDQQKWDITKKNFTDIKNHGIDTVFLYGGPCSFGANFNACEKAVSIAKNVGLKRVVLYLTPRHYSGDYIDYVNMMKSYGFEPWFFGFDEMGSTSADYGMVDHIKKSMLIHKAGGKVVTTGTKAAADRLTNPNDPIYTANFPMGTLEPVDWMVYPMADYRYFTDIMAGRVSKTPNRLEAYYWQTYEDNPLVYRYRCGFFLDLNKLDTCNPTFYLARTSKNFYNEFDYFDTGVKWREYMLAGPSREGPVPTVQWEAYREAIDDSKYLATWRNYKNLVAKTNPTLAQASERVVNNVLNHYKDTTDAVWSSRYSAEQRNSAAQYVADRKTIIAEIKKMQAAARNTMPTSTPTRK
jgi:hypothetical protein